MGRSKNQIPGKPTRSTRPSIDPEARENQLIALAVDCAEKQLLDGTASAQVIAYSNEIM